MRRHVFFFDPSGTFWWLSPPPFSFFPHALTQYRPQGVFYRPRAVPPLGQLSDSSAYHFPRYQMVFAPKSPMWGFLHDHESPFQLGPPVAARGFCLSLSRFEPPLLFFFVFCLGRTNLALIGSLSCVACRPENRPPVNVAEPWLPPRTRRKPISFVRFRRTFSVCFGPWPSFYLPHLQWNFCTPCCSSSLPVEISRCAFFFSDPRNRLSFSPPGVNFLSEPRRQFGNFPILESMLWGNHLPDTPRLPGKSPLSGSVSRGNWPLLPF